MTGLLRGVLLLCGLGLLALDAHAVTPMVATGYDHSIGLSADGKVYGWGNDALGQLGMGQLLMATTPQAVPGLNLGQWSGKSRVAFGFAHIVTVKSDGSVWAWGDNGYAELGDGTYDSRPTYVGVLNDTLSGFLDLDPTVPNLPVPAEKIPPFFLAASKSGDLSSLALSARVRLAPVNLNGNTPAQANRFAAGCGSGGTCQMYVAAHAPAGVKTPVCAPASAYATESWWSADAQRNWNGLAWPLPAFLSNVTPGQDQIV